METKAIALEPTILVAINSELHNSILMKSVEKELDAKLRVLKKVNILSEQDNVVLVAMAAVIKIERY